MEKMILNILFLSILVSCTPSYEDLKDAIENGDQDLVLKYIDKNIDLNDNSEGIYPLFIALEKSDFEICKFLIENTADVNIENEERRTPLFITYQKNDFNFIKLFVENGADVNINVGSKNKEKLLIFDAIESGKEEIAKVILSGNLDLNAVDENQYSIALYAVLYGSFDFFKYVIDFGIPINLLDDDGESPLVVALDMGYLEKAKILIDSGALIENYRFTWSMLVEYWNEGASEIAEIYLDKKVPINSKTDDPILTCVVNSEVDAMKWFLEHDFDPKRENEYGETPIDFVWKIFSRDEEEDKPLALIRDEMYSLLNQYGAVEKSPSWF